MACSKYTEKAIYREAERNILNEVFYLKESDIKKKKKKRGTEKNIIIKLLLYSESKIKLCPRTDDGTHTNLPK